VLAAAMSGLGTVWTWLYIYGGTEFEELITLVYGLDDSDPPAKD
jgi:hypothetical protein